MTRTARQTTPRTFHWVRFGGCPWTVGVVGEKPRTKADIRDGDCQKIFLAGDYSFGVHDERLTFGEEVIKPENLLK